MSVGRTPGPGIQFSFMLMSISAWCGELRGEESGAAMESWESTELLSTERLLRCSSLSIYWKGAKNGIFVLFVGYPDF